uniref:Dihydrofolate synthetase-related n=1 Tax=Brassica oleracea TaxID=3712 RepID=Q25BM4_BRAOL|nr:dihydrofolate synthetase -related [Brassica oleracea]
MTSFLSLDGKIAAWSSSFQSTPKQPDEAMRVLEGKAFELDVNLEVVQPLTATQLSFACLYLASANCILSGRSSQSRKHGRHHSAIWLLCRYCYSIACQICCFHI